MRNEAKGYRRVAATARGNWKLFQPALFLFNVLIDSTEVCVSVG